MRVNDHKQENLLSGFIDVKVPTKGRKIGPWKAWKRQWCAVQKSTTDNCVELALGNNSKNVNNTLIIPDFSILCRSESRTRPYAFGIFVTENKNHHAVVFLSGRSETESQQYMSHIRMLLQPHTIPVSGEEFSVSLIDNSFSRSSGLYGIYGILNLNETEMVIRNPVNGEVVASWKWSQIERHYVRESTPSSDDSGKIFVFQIRCEYRTNYGGKLCLFCPQAEDLHSAVSQYRLGRQHRLVTSPLPPTPSHPGFHSMRRLSRSEGDLRWPIDSSIALLHLRSRSSSRDRNSKTLMDGDNETERNSLGKIARSLILASASFSLLLSTPGCSDPDSLHEYQAIPQNHLDRNYDNSQHKFFHDINKSRSQTDIDHDNEIDDLGDLFSHSYFRTTSAPCGTLGSRRVSGASVASGIYAEIDENPAIEESEIRYQNLSDFGTDCPFSMYSSKPPPLPPRRTNEHFNYRSESVLKNSLTNESSDNRLNEQNKDQVTNERQLQQVDNYIPESQYITINIKEMQDDKEQIKKPPPSLPPRRLCDIIVRADQNIASPPNLTDTRENMQLQKCDGGKKQDAQITEPDYLPMSQVPTKMPINNDIYVVMANIINNKISNVAESGP